MHSINSTTVTLTKAQLQMGLSFREACLWLNVPSDHPSYYRLQDLFLYRTRVPVWEIQDWRLRDPYA